MSTDGASTREDPTPEPTQVAGVHEPPSAPVVIAGFDGSQASEHALVYAAGVSRRIHGSLLVVYVAPNPLVLGSEWFGDQLSSAWLADDGARVRTHAEDTLHGTTLRWHFVLAQGEPATVLKQLVHEHRGDMLIVGQSRSSARLVLGSVPGRLARHSSCPITVVP
jgi:nucleotide-binding universal stress UspA family protein